MWMLLTAGASAEPPKHIEIPDPFEEEEPPPAPVPEVAPAPAPAAPGGATRRPIRNEVRPFTGEIPVNVYGRYTVAEVTEAGQTEDFQVKMERAGNALNEDCIITRMTFDFGPAPAEGATGHRPGSVEVSQVQRCDRGGLGTYADELAFEVPVTWSKGEGALQLALPAATVTSEYVRLRRPNDGDMRTPPQWLAPETKVVRKGTTYDLLAELPPKWKKDEMPVLHMKMADMVLHLEADPRDGPFDARPDPAGK